jgi:hypothetical protein
LFFLFCFFFFVFPFLFFNIFTVFVISLISKSPILPKSLHFRNANKKTLINAIFRPRWYVCISIIVYLLPNFDIQKHKKTSSSTFSHPSLPPSLRLVHKNPYSCHHTTRNYECYPSYSFH